MSGDGLNPNGPEKRNSRDCALPNMQCFTCDFYARNRTVGVRTREAHTTHKTSKPSPLSRTGAPALPSFRMRKGRRAGPGRDEGRDEKGPIAVERHWCAPAQAPTNPLPPQKKLGGSISAGTQSHT